MATIPVAPPIPNSIVSVSNIKNLIPTTLDYTNYMLWRELFLPVFKGHGVYGFIDGSHPCPEPTLTMENGTSTINPVFQQWVQLDSIVLSWIQATISQEILQAIIRPNNSLTAREAWLQIEHLVLQVLSGLPSEYLSVSTSIYTRIPLPSFLETRSLLFLHETQLNGLSFAASDSSTALLAKHNSSSQGRGRGRNSNGGCHANGGRGRGRNNNNDYHRNYSTAPLQFAPRPNASSILGPAPHSSPSSFYPSYPAAPSPFQCQLCFQPTHTARDCPSLCSKALFSDLQSFSFAHSYDPAGHTPWYVDTGASSHMTPNPSHLSSVQPYNGNDRVMVGNGNQLPISYTVKQKSDGSLERYKARLVAQGYNKKHGLDYDQTFSPVVKPVTIRTVFALAASKGWEIHQLDVKNAFLHGTLNELVYMKQLTGFVHPQFPLHVCRLNKALYGLKQAPQTWFHWFTSFLVKHGFKNSFSDNSLFIYKSASDIIILLLYVDDILITLSLSSLPKSIIKTLMSEFSMRDLGLVHFFLGISVSTCKGGYFLNQSKYIHDLLNRAGLFSSKPINTPLSPKSLIAFDKSPPFFDPSLYRSLVGGLQYLTFSRPDIAFSISQVAQFMHSPLDIHFTAVKRILYYLRGSINHGLFIPGGSIGSLTCYTDADWAGYPTTRRSTSAYCIFIGNNLISWSSKKQSVVSRSSAEAEYRFVAHGTAEISWLLSLLGDLHIQQSSPSTIYCDNIISIYLSHNPVHHARTKHIEIDIHFVREKVASGVL
ncbi:hypothetical protein MTR67_044423 [Solanum verrucosum]|uniref:Reverse transcriptase Ty1/copia-type domain-containing protein n=1 Tax=Solanum verrucosum TaxID=315347 RepID=A0AAF0UQI8_SOLVR|nr:hypothetical protein MTR67_044423 [Solanum verrucosum]